MNLLEETIDILNQHGKTASDVLWVQIWEEDTDKTTWFSWEDFAQLADFDYDSGYGLEEVDLSLMIVGNNWWLERDEYDGSEGWAYKEKPKKPKIRRIPLTLRSR